MPSGMNHKLYFRIRHWVDKTLAVPVMTPATLAPVCFILLPCAALEYLTNGAAPNVLVWASALAAVGWMAFVGWRGLRMAKAGMLKSSRDYDRRGKHLLPEYAASESALAARLRKRRATRHSAAR